MTIIRLVMPTCQSLTGTYGMSAYVNDETYLQVREDTPDAEPTYHARFYLDALRARLASGLQFKMFQVRSGDTSRSRCTTT